MGMRHLYVFDLDGTLADTAELSVGRRTPAHLLDADPLDYELDVSPAGWAKVNELGVDVSTGPGLASASGHETAIITRAPQAYASTLVGLLGLERHLMWPSSTGADVASKLRQLAGLHRLPMDRVVYVGDTRDDEAAARQAGCEFIHVDAFEGPYENESLRSESVNEDSVADMVASLIRNPLHRRLELQTRLARLVRPEHRYCLVRPRQSSRQISGAFTEASISPRLFTRDERGETYQLFLRNLFPAHRTNRVRASSGDSHYICGYVKLDQEGTPGADPLGNLFRIIKQYRRTSGPEVEFGPLPLAAHVLAAHIASWFRGFSDIGGFGVDHVAPSPFSPETPGRTSSWLARMVADTVGATLGTEWQAISTVLRTGNQLRPNPEYDTTPRWTVLIDDQRTVGDSLARHLDCSPLPEWEATLTWSQSNPPTPTGPDPRFRRSTPGCFWPDEGSCPVHGESRFVAQPEAPQVERAREPEPEVNSGVANVLSTLRTHPNAWAPWDPGDDEALARLAAEGRTTQDMARILKRTPGAITSRLKKLRDGLV